VNPPLALVTHNPLLTIISRLEVNLFAVKTVQLLFVLFQTYLTQTFHIVLVGEIVLGRLISRTNLVTANVRVSLSF
jgi:hypothetical protein